MSVFIMPGSNATTVILFGTSFANDLLNPSIPHFEQTYAETYKLYNHFNITLYIIFQSDVFKIGKERVLTQKPFFHWEFHHTTSRLISNSTYKNLRIS